MNIPREIDIKRIAYPSAESLLEKVLGSVQRKEQSTQTIMKHLPADISRALVEVTTIAWRLAARTKDLDGEPKMEISKDDIRKLVRYIESLTQALTEIGIEVKDRTGETFDYGLPEKVVTSQPQEGITKEYVLETLRPTIYFRGQIAQQGEVIIATPITEDLCKHNIMSSTLPASQKETPAIAIDGNANDFILKDPAPKAKRKVTKR